MYRKCNLVESSLAGRFLLTIILLITFIPAISQPTVLRGKVTDEETGNSVAYVTVLIKNTQIGTLTDTLGNFLLTSKVKVDSVQFSKVGYISKTTVGFQ